MASKRASGEGADEPLFREFEHTGDLGIEVNAASRAELFRRAAIALAALMVEPAEVAASERREVEVQADTDADLLHDLLAELLDLFVIDAFIWREAAVVEHGRSLKVTLRGEHFDASRHQFRGEIKAVTYHQLAVEQSPQGWRAHVIFDV
jgi:SHS2 domain-containing protein